MATESLTYEEFLARFDLRHIQPQEIINPHRQTTRGVTNSLPPHRALARHARHPLHR